MSEPSRWLLGILGMLLLASSGMTQTPGFDDPPRIPSTPLSPRLRSLREAQTLYGSALLSERRDELIEALKLLDEAVRLDPKAIAPRKARLPLQRAIGRIDEMFEGCREVLKRDPGDAETAFFFAEQLREQGRVAEAVDVLVHGLTKGRLKERPDLRVRMWRQLGLLREQLDDKAGAESALTQLAAAMTAHADALKKIPGVTDESLARDLGRSAEDLGRLRLALKKYAQAAKAFRLAKQVLEKANDPAAVGRANWGLAEAAHRAGQPEEALQALEEYLALRPRQIEPYELKVQLLDELGRGASGLNDLHKQAAAQPTFLPLQLLWAKRLVQAGRVREADETYETLARSYPEADVYRDWFQLYLNRRRVSEILRRIDDTLRIAGDDKSLPGEREAAAGRARAMLAAVRNQPVLVRALVTQALAEYDRRPDRLRSYHTFRILAELAERIDQPEAAERLFRASLDRGVPLAFEEEIYHGLIHVLFRQHKYREVLEICREALRVSEASQKELFHFHEALALVELDQPKEAMTAAARAVAAAGERNKMTVRGRQIDILLLVGKPKEALAQCEALLKDAQLPAQVRMVRLKLSMVHEALRQHDESEQQLRLILADDPDDATANNNLGYQLADRGDKLEEAEQLIRKAIRLDREQRKGQPGMDADNATFLDSLGWVLLRRGQANEARTILEQAVKLRDGAEEPVLWDHLGDVYASLGETARAKTAYEKALKFYAFDRRSRVEGRPEEVQRKLRRLNRVEEPRPAVLK